MKNSVKTIITGAVCAAIAITGIGAGSVLTSAKLAEKKSIGSEAAYSAALNDAGVTSEKASEIKIDFERENGKYVFEVEFDTDDKEYDYFVDAKNGDIISRKVENKSNIEITEKLTQTTVPSTTEKSDNNSVQTTEKATENNISANLLNLEEAKKSVLKDAGLKSSEVTFTKAKLDEDNHYDIEFYTSSKKYEYEISALTGKIIDKDIEYFSNTSSTTVSSSANSKITLDEAKKTALKDAGLNSSDVKFTKAKLDDGNHYDIEFYTSSKKYEYEINALTGKIIDKDIEYFSNTSSTTVSSSANSKITLDEAKKAALVDAGLNSSDVKFTKAKLDDGNHYDIEFYTSSKKYEYEISALTGKIIDKETENLKSSSTTTDKTSAESIISVDKAKEIALKKAGLKASDVRFIKAKLEFDDGIQVYQIEFISGSYEYEAEINARNGNIIDFSREIDD